jgi:hypothetical protein
MVVVNVLKFWTVWLCCTRPGMDVTRLPRIVSFSIRLPLQSLISGFVATSVDRNPRSSLDRIRVGGASISFMRNPLRYLQSW